MNTSIQKLRVRLGIGLMGAGFLLFILHGCEDPDPYVTNINNLLSCSVECCDGSYINASDQADENQCKLASQGVCDSHSGIAFVDFNGSYIVSNPMSCPALPASNCEVVCCDDTYLVMQTQADAATCISLSDSACNAHASVSYVFFNGQEVLNTSDLCPPPPTSWECTAHCCDGTVDGFDKWFGKEVDSNQCIYLSGKLCGNHGGPISIDHQQDVVWESQYSCPSTLRPCSGLCCDGKTIPESPGFDADACALDIHSACKDHGGHEISIFDGMVDGDPNTNLGCEVSSQSSTCVALCCDGTTGDGGTPPENACSWLGGSTCADHGGPVYVKHNGTVVWNHSTECSTLRPCSVICKNGSTQNPGETFDQNACVFFHLKDCDPYGGAQCVKFGNVVAWGSCP